MGLILSAAVILGFFAGITYIAVQQCIIYPNLCNTTSNVYHPAYNYNYYWKYSAGIVVTTSEGQVKGLTWSSRMGKGFYAFLGIPYGEIPLRFEVSRPYPRWDGVRDATMYGPMCTQLDRRTQIISGSENCLFLNVFTPQIISTQLLPVMVWIDGSMGWQHGSGDKINPRNFMDEHVVLVTFNFRLSALGFLCTGDGEIQGNMGLKDQLLALMWVKQNIHNFGGDPNRVTLFGSDSGAASVHLHMLSPLSKGLFHRAISQSGAAHCPWTLQKNPSGKATLLAQKLNCDITSTKAMADCMKYKSGNEILEAELKLKTPNWNGEQYALFGPTVEKIAYKSQAFLPETPTNLISTGQFMKVPWIIGFNEEEGRYFVSKVLNSNTLTDTINNQWNTLAPISFLYEENTASQASKDGLSSKIKTFYFGSKMIGKDTWENYTNAYTDRYYMTGIVDAIKAHSSMSQVYPYIFKYRGDFSYTEMIHGDYSYKHAPSHFDELFYLFNWEWTHVPQMGYTYNNYMEFSQKLVKLWVSFAETGIPRSTWGTTTEWRPASPLDPFVHWYLLDYDTHTMMDDAYKARIELWKSLGINEDMFINK